MTEEPDADESDGESEGDVDVQPAETEPDVEAAKEELEAVGTEVDGDPSERGETGSESVTADSATSDDGDAESADADGADAADGGDESLDPDGSDGQSGGEDTTEDQPGDDEVHAEDLVDDPSEREVAGTDAAAAGVADADGVVGASETGASDGTEADATDAIDADTTDGTGAEAPADVASDVDDAGDVATTADTPTDAGDAPDETTDADAAADETAADDAAADDQDHQPGVPADVRKYDRFTKVDGAQYDRVNEFLRDRTYITAREWAIARLCSDFRTETGVEMTKIGENLPGLVPFMTDTYTAQAVNQARASFEDKVRTAGATFLYGAMCDFFTAEELDDVMYEATEVAKFLLEVEGVELSVEEELEAEDRISAVMRDVRESSAELRHEECPECGHRLTGDE